jgi:SAM-dependent methyltransferase
MKELLLGCGSRTQKDLSLEGRKEFQDVVRLDNNADHNPDVIWDLNCHPLPFKDNEFDEIHAYDVLEHLGGLGDYKFFFREFSEYWRILKPGGMLLASVPDVSSPWLFGDPSHVRVISKETLVFLSQDQYTQQIGKTKMSDFRYLYQADFKCVYAQETGGTFRFILEAVK